MNKYARIDKKCRKMFVYYQLHFGRNMRPSQIAKIFGVKDETVIKAIKIAMHTKPRYDGTFSEHRRAVMLSWTYI